MGISGFVEAKCNACQCVFRHYLEGFPFKVPVIRGTCWDCVNKKTHDCFNENFIGKNNLPVKLGTKKFKKKAVKQ